MLHCVARMKQSVLGHGAFVGAVFLVACGGTSTKDDESTSTDLAALAESNVEQALRGAHRAGSFLADSAALADSLGSLGGGSESCDTACDSSGFCTTTCTTDPVTVADLQQSRDDMSASIDSIMKELREKIFSKENLESEGNGSVTYLLGPKTLCASTTVSTPTVSTPGGPSPPQGGTAGTAGTASTPTAEPELDPDCVDQVSRLEPRLRLSSPSAGNVDVELLLTSSKLNPATLELYRDHAGVVVDLGDIKSTLDMLGESTGSLDSLVGKLGFEIRKNHELDYSLRANVLADVVVGMHDDLGNAVSYGVGASTPTAEVRLDGNARELLGSWDLGAITVKAPLNAFRDTFDPEQYDSFGYPIPRPTYQGALEFLLAGIEGTATFDGNTEKLALSHLGLGDTSSTLKVDGNVLAALDVNAMNGRHFDLLVEKRSAGTSLTFSPTLDTSLLLNFAPLANQISDIPPELMNDTLRFWLDGQSPSLEVGGDQLKVLAGTLNFTNTYDPTQNVSAAPGQCVASSTSDSATSAFVVTACQ